MANLHYSVMKLSSCKKQLCLLLKPYLRKEYHLGRYRSEDLIFEKILSSAQNPESSDHNKQEHESYQGRSFVVEGRFYANEYFFCSLNRIPFPVYQNLSTLIGEKISVEVHSNDEFFVGKWEFRPDGLMRTVFYQEDPSFHEKPKSEGRIRKSLRDDLHIELSKCFDSDGNKFEDLLDPDPEASNTTTSETDVPF
jgi:hypothetical protein